MKQDTWTELCTALAQGPSVLFLGQHYRRLLRSDDAFLAYAAKYLQRLAPANYSDLLDAPISSRRVETIAHLHSLAQRIGVPAFFAELANCPWNAVITSAIDSGIEQALETPWRHARPVLNDRFAAEFPRSRSMLHVYRLFGSVDRDLPDEVPPLTTGELYARHQAAVAMLREVPQIVTPLGKLFVEGYDLDDWMEPRDLVGAFLMMAPGQVHVFSATEDFRQRREFSALRESGRLTFHTESILDLLAFGRERGVLRDASEYVYSTGSYRVTLPKGNVCRLSAETGNRLAASVIVLDDDATAAPDALSAEQTYLEFREFLRGTPSVPRWDHYIRGFAFRRDAQALLLQHVDRELTRSTLRSRVIVLHGQSGSGKTIALADLACLLRSRSIPVGFIPRRNVAPDHSDLDILCETFELSGADRTVLIWDGMRDAVQYIELADYLASRGRKVVLVGSAYRQTATDTRRREGILWQEIPASLSRAEADRLALFLHSIDPGFHESADDIFRRADAAFFVALYRLLPPTRGELRRGLVREYGLAQEALRESDAGEDAPSSFGTALRLALDRKYPELLHKAPIQASGVAIPEDEELIGLILVPGRFGLHPPIELVARAARGYSFERILRTLNAFDVFRWDQDPAGRVTIGPRHSLEAEEVLNARYGSPEIELEFIRRLLLGLKATPSIEDESEELEFVIALLQAVGPQGRAAARFSFLLSKIASVIAEVREQKGALHPRLLLLEGNVSRESAKRLQQRPDTENEQLEILQRAQTALESAVRVVEPLAQRPRFHSLLANLHVELASLHGARIVVYGRMSQAPPQRVREEYRAVREHVTRARKYRPTTYYPLDVLFWASRDYLSSQQLNDAEYADIVADLIAEFDEPLAREYEPAQQEQYESRRVELAQMTGHQSLQEAALTRLAAMNSVAGIYILARNEAYGDLRAGGRTPLSDERARAALQLLETHRSLTFDDVRCLNLALQLTWWLHNHKHLFETERSAPALSQDQWRTVLDIDERLHQLTRDAPRPSVLYVRGMALFHLGRFTDSEEQFRELDRIPISGSRRVVAHYMYSDPTGSPIKLSGTVRSANPEGTRGLVYCPAILRTISFVPQDFRRADLKQGTTLDAFYISFRFRGILAEDVRFYDRRNDRE